MKRTVEGLYPEISGLEKEMLAAKLIGKNISFIFWRAKGKYFVKIIKDILPKKFA